LGKNKIRTTPPRPLGGLFLGFLNFFLENIRRRSVRVLKLHRGFILTKKGENEKCPELSEIFEKFN
jgi:hypothetical protein